jgi:transcription initiation factor TFIIE subunit alpha
MMPFNEELLTKAAKIVGGEDAVKVVDAIKTLGETTDDKIAMETGMRLNDVRKILYKLSNHSIVSSTRSRDPESGWFIFNWTLQPDQIEGYIQNMKKRILEKLEARLKYEVEHEFYFCNNPSCRRVTFEDAVEFIFRCPNCGQQLKHFEKDKTVKLLSEKIKKLKNELGE